MAVDSAYIGGLAGVVINSIVSDFVGKINEK